jgi:hypothetical protein
LSQNEQQGCASDDHRTLHIQMLFFFAIHLILHVCSVEMKFIKSMAEYQLHDLHDTWVLNINRRPI